MKGLGPAGIARGVRARPTLSGLPLEDQVGLHQAAPGLEEPSEQQAGDGVGRAGDDSKRTSGEAQIGRVGLDDGNVVAPKSLAKRRRSCAGGSERGRDYPRPRSDVEDEVAGAAPATTRSPVTGARQPDSARS